MGRMPERDLRTSHGKRRLSNTTVGIIALILTAIGSWLAFTKEIPFTGDGYTLKATFNNSVNIRKDSPVRVAGVNVGKVIDSDRDGDKAVVTFTVEEGARPIREDAFVAIRPRIFFEGNFFLDLVPGSPGSEEMESGDTIPVSRTATAVQLDELLTALQAPQRQDLGELLSEYGESLNRKPTAAEDLTQDPEVHGKSGGEALNAGFKYGPTAGRATAQVAEAFQGTEPDDLSRLIASSSRFFGALANREGELQSLVTNFNVTMGAFAAESRSLSAAIERLGPTLEIGRESFANLNASLPPLRRFSIEFEPAVAELPETIREADPWLAAVRPLLARSALGSVAGSLERATPGLAGAQAAGIGALRQLNFLNRCTVDVLVPTGNQIINDQFSLGQPNYREFFYATVNIAGESQGFDGNGPYLRLQAGGGPTRATTTDPAPVPNLPNNRVLSTNTIEPPIGTQPILGPRPAKNGKAKCMNQGIPDLNGPLGQVGPPSPSAP